VALQASWIQPKVGIAHYARNAEEEKMSKFDRYVDNVCTRCLKPQILKLTYSDSRMFVETLLNPPEPNDALKAAAERHKKELK
jgi:uncharacterized protein (DUF1778 family)